MVRRHTPHGARIVVVAKAPLSNLQSSNDGVLLFQVQIDDVVWAVFITEAGVDKPRNDEIALAPAGTPYKTKCRLLVTVTVTARIIGTDVKATFAIKSGAAP